MDCAAGGLTYIGDVMYEGDDERPGIGRSRPAAQCRTTHSDRTAWGERGPRRQPRQHRTNDLAAIAFPGRLNSVVQSAGSAAGGFGNTVYFKTVIFFRLGKLDFTARMQLSYAIHRK